MRRASERHRALIALVFVGGLAALPECALAQANPGAERYEVTITPPKRPGGEATTPEAAAAAAATKEAGSPSAAEAASGAARSDASPVTDLPPGDSATAPGKGPETSAMLAPAPPPNLPMKTLQVGAFRQQASARKLHDELAAIFSDVAIVEVQSGGEPLYRVNVGRLPRGPQLDELRRRLVAGGHPAFEVIAPPVGGN